MVKPPPKLPGSFIGTYAQFLRFRSNDMLRGATSCYVTDNADLMFLNEGLKLVLSKLATVIRKLSAFALKYKDRACLGYTHGKRLSSVCCIPSSHTRGV